MIYRLKCNIFGEFSTQIKYIYSYISLFPPSLSFSPTLSLSHILNLSLSIALLTLSHNTILFLSTAPSEHSGWSNLLDSWCLHHWEQMAWRKWEERQSCLHPCQVTSKYLLQSLIFLFISDFFIAYFLNALWFMIWCLLIWYHIISYDMIWYDMIWHAITSYHLIWYDMMRLFHPILTSSLCIILLLLQSHFPSQLFFTRFL